MAGLPPATVAAVPEDSPPVLLQRLSHRNATELPLVRQATVMLQDLVEHGAALGWVEPPSQADVARLLAEVASLAASGDASLVAAFVGEDLAALGYWRRYARPTHRPHADIEKVAVSRQHQARGLGRQVMQALVDDATASGVEVLTLDFRGDNHRAAKLYDSLGFREYGRLDRFVAVGPRRFDMVLYARHLPSAAAGE